MKFLALLVLGATPLVHANAIPKTSRALYFLDSDPAGASIVALPVDQKTGQLGQPVKTSTGGLGLISHNAMGQVTVDPLFSQDPVVIHGSNLFTVNPGSNTLAHFHIGAHDPLHPVLLGTPVPTGGDVPNTLAYSAKHDIVCVANTGPHAGVQCFKVAGYGNLKPQGALRPLPVDQTATPLGPPGTVSDVLFNPSETALFVVVKGADGKTPGYIFVYPVQHGEVSETPIVSRPPEIPLGFGTVFTSETTAIITDPSYGAAYVNIARDYTVTVSHKITIPNQKAACWVRASRNFDAAYILDGGNSSVVTLDPFSGKTKYVIPGAVGTMGNFDGVVDRSWLYALQATPAITVFNLKGSQHGRKIPSVAQTLDLSALGNRAAWTGLAIWSN
ncbi:Fc.00g062390.m01.CDS01 [Cosmosporella sp. VM-42]